MKVPESGVKLKKQDDMRTVVISIFFLFYSVLTTYAQVCPSSRADFLDGGVFTGPCNVDLENVSRTVTGSITYTGDLTFTNAATSITITNSFAFGGGTLTMVGTPGNIVVGNGGNFTTTGTINAGGTIDVAAGGTLTINGGTVTTLGTGDNAIQGTLEINGGVINFTGDLAISGSTASVTMNGGNLNISGDEGDLEVTTGGTFTINGGNLDITDDLTTAGSNGNIIINTITVDIGGEVSIAATGSLTSTNATTPGSINLTGNFTDNNCASDPYPAGTYAFCNCPTYTACTASLPVELQIFSGIQEGNSVKLNWVTLTETNNHYFTVERLMPNDEFEKVVTVEGSGTNLLPKSYSAIDKFPVNGKNYYRLRQTDFDGKTSSFDLLKVEVELVQATLEISPNPAVDGECIVHLSGLKPHERVTIEMHNVLGKALWIKDLVASGSGQLTHALDIGQLAPGIYFISAQRITKKLLKH